MWLADREPAASAHVTSSLSGPRRAPRSAPWRRRTVSACRSISSRQAAAHAVGVAVGTLSGAGARSSASSRCRRVSVWLRRSSPIAAAA